MQKYIFSLTLLLLCSHNSIFSMDQQQVSNTEKQEQELGNPGQRKPQGINRLIHEIWVRGNAEVNSGLEYLRDNNFYH